MSGVTSIAATIEPPVSAWASIICCRHGVSAAITSSGRITAKGSSPTSRRAHHTAWPSPERLGLPKVGNGARGHVGGRQRLQELVLALLAQRRLELGRVVEVVLQRGLAARGDEDELLDPRRARLVDGVLDERPVNEGHDLLRDGLGRRKEPGPEPRDGEDGFGDGSSHGVPHGQCGRAARASGKVAHRRGCARRRRAKATRARHANHPITDLCPRCGVARHSGSRTATGRTIATEHRSRGLGVG